MVDLGGGESGVIPVQRIVMEVKLDGVGPDPAGEAGVGEGVPREALAPEQGGA